MASAHGLLQSHAGADVEGTVATCRQSDACIFIVGTTMLDGDSEVQAELGIVSTLHCRHVFHSLLRLILALLSLTLSRTKSELAHIPWSQLLWKGRVMIANH